MVVAYIESQLELQRNLNVYLDELSKTLLAENAEAKLYSTIARSGKINGLIFKTLLEIDGYDLCGHEERWTLLLNCLRHNPVDIDGNSFLKESIIDILTNELRVVINSDLSCVSVTIEDVSNWLDNLIDSTLKTMAKIKLPWDTNDNEFMGITTVYNIPCEVYIKLSFFDPPVINVKPICPLSKELIGYDLLPPIWWYLPINETVKE